MTLHVRSCHGQPLDPWVLLETLDMTLQRLLSYSTDTLWVQVGAQSQAQTRIRPVFCWEKGRPETAALLGPGREALVW